MTRPHHIARCDEYDVSVIVPCYNEAPILEQSLRDLRWVMGQTSYRWELIAIDDASCDETPRLLERLLADRPDTRVILHRSNLGRGGTVTEGLALARVRPWRDSLAYCGAIRSFKRRMRAEGRY